jgi:hypothetical protein
LVALPLSHYLWQGVTTKSHLFPSLRLLLATSDWRKTSSASSCHVICLSACNILSLLMRSKSSLPRPRPRQQRSIDINGAISDACQDAVRSSHYLRLSPTSNHVPFLLLSSYFRFYRRILETVGVPQQSAPNNLLNPASSWHSCFQYRTTSGNSV